MENPRRSASKVNSKKIFNHLKDEKSPYLIQHSNNPVDWYPWCDEAFKKAKKEDKPIFLSIGYSTCHWCHVMAHESFEDPEVAELINKVFVAVKVDREERPDIDSIYMTACQILTGSGGWPLTIIMAPDKKPFFAGTYFPRESGFGAIGIKDLILNVRDIWNNNRKEVINSGNQVVNALQDISNTHHGEKLGKGILDVTYNELSKVFDEENGGFGDFQKFPTPHNLMFLLRYWKRTGNIHALDMVTKTLNAMAKGGIYDHIGSGFHRYSVDRLWLVPHFEKMLYDQALITMAYIETYQATGISNYIKTAKKVFEYVLRDMKSPEGGFYSAEDADSEGVEGKFYLWTAEEIKNVLNDDETNFIAEVYDIKEDGNFNDGYSSNSNENILHMKHEMKELEHKFGMDEIKVQDKIEIVGRKLFDAREKRVHPHKDDKILTDWNGLMIASLAKAGQVFGDEKYSNASMDAADFILDNMMSNGRLMHRYRDGQRALDGNLDDYAFFIWGLLEIYTAVFDLKYLKAAINLNKTLLAHFWDDIDGGFYFTADDGEKLLMREKNTYDSAIPSGNSVELLNLIRIARITEDPDLEAMAVRMETVFSEKIKRSTTAHTQFITAVDYAIGPSFEVVIVGKSGSNDTINMLNSIKKEYIPNKIIIFKDSDNPDEVKKIAESLEFKETIDGKATAHICTAGSCKIPTSNIDEILKLLRVK